MRVKFDDVKLHSRKTLASVETLVPRRPLTHRIVPLLSWSARDVPHRRPKVDHPKQITVSVSLYQKSNGKSQMDKCEISTLMCESNRIHCPAGYHTIHLSRVVCVCCRVFDLLIISRTKKGWGFRSLSHVKNRTKFIKWTNLIKWSTYIMATFLLK